MRVSVVRLAILAYPRRWRRRYGRELEQLTVSVLQRPQTPIRKLGIVLDLVIHGVDERVRRTESTGPKAALTSMSTLLAGMVVLAGGLASDSALAHNVQVSGSIHLGARVSLVRGDASAHDRPNHGGEIDVVEPAKPGGQVSVDGGRSAVVINTRSDQVVAVTRAGRFP